MGLMKKFLGLEEKKPLPKLGRNDPCWCGSGKKYKHCHLETDSRKRSGERASCFGSS